MAERQKRRRWLEQDGTPTPPKKVKPPSPPRIIPVHAPAPPKPVGRIQNPVVDAQFPDAITCLSRLGINLVEPSKDQMRRMIEKYKKRPMG